MLSISIRERQSKFIDLSQIENKTIEEKSVNDIKWFNIGGVYFNISMNIIANHRYSLLERLASYDKRHGILKYI